MTEVLEVPITWRDVESTSVERVGWFDGGMVVEFTGDRYYAYLGVSRQRAVAMAYAIRLTKLASVGKYLNQRVKPNFECRRIV